MMDWDGGVNMVMGEDEPFACIIHKRVNRRDRKALEWDWVVSPGILYVFIVSV